MTRLYIDTEFNGFGGELISVGLVAETGQEFYEVLSCANPDPWVAEHVIPFLGQEPITRAELQERLQHFLFQFVRVEIIADWPDDIKYFCETLITEPGCAINHPPISFVLDRTLSSDGSQVPHNALHDARAIAEEHQTKLWSER